MAPAKMASASTGTDSIKGLAQSVLSGRIGACSLQNLPCGGPYKS